MHTLTLSLSLSLTHTHKYTHTLKTRRTCLDAGSGYKHLISPPLLLYIVKLTLKYGRRVGGYVTSYGQNFNFLTIRGAGHMVLTAHISLLFNSKSCLECPVSSLLCALLYGGILCAHCSYNSQITPVFGLAYE
jgi:hypothetical protein